MASPLFPDLVVNGEKVPSTVVAAETQNHSAPEGKPGFAWRKAANAIAIRTLLLQEARRLNFEASIQEVEPGRFETEEEALVRGLLEVAIDVRRPTEEEIYAEWARDPERFQTPLLWEASHILSACDVSDIVALKRAHTHTEDLISQLRTDPGNFADLARTQSDCSSATDGGFLGQIVSGDMAPEFESHVRSLQEGQITPEPVLTQFGYHVIRLDAVAPRRVMPFKAAHAIVEAAMEKAAWANAARSYVDALVKTADISGADPGRQPC